MDILKEIKKLEEKLTSDFICRPIQYHGEVEDRYYKRSVLDVLTELNDNVCKLNLCVSAIDKAISDHHVDNERHLLCKTLLPKDKQESIIHVGDYMLEVHPGGRLWIRNKGGEGAEVSLKYVERMFRKTFKENF